MGAGKIGRRPLFLTAKTIRNSRCKLTLKNKSGKRAYIVIRDVESDSVREMTFKGSRKLRLLKGTYVIEAWYKTGNIGINPENIQHVSIENLFSTKFSGLRGKKIVADLHHEKEQLIMFEEITVADIIQKGP